MKTTITIENGKITVQVDDPWNCGMCRNAGDLCDMHEKMTADGKVPPL